MRGKAAAVFAGILTLTASCAATLPVASVHSTPSSGTLLFDHFNGPAGSGPPSNLLYSTGAGWARGELQSYSTSRDNVYQDGRGDLVLKAIRGASGMWTSGRLTTSESFYQTTVSAKILFPDQSGMWPAFWMENVSNEIDIMELYGNHSWFDGSALHNSRYQIHEGYSMPHPVRGWHVWTVKWGSSDIRFYEDGNVYYAARTPTAFRNGAGMRVILNLAVGGAGGGTVPGATKTIIMLVKWLLVTKGRS